MRIHQIWVPPSKRAVSATVVQSRKRTVADGHRLAAIITSTAHELSGGTNIDDLEPQNRGF